jgi:hypothetical protein
MPRAQLRQAQPAVRNRWQARTGARGIQLRRLPLTSAITQYLADMRAPGDLHEPPIASSGFSMTSAGHAANGVCVRSLAGISSLI